MVYKSRWTIPVPSCSLATFLFKSVTHDLSDQPAFIDAEHPESRFLTRNDLRLWSQRFALGLQRSKHFKPGDRVLVFSNNSIFFPVAFMGIVMAGGIFSAANPTFTARELAYQWKDCEATYLLCVDTAIDVGIEAADLIGVEKDRVFVFNTQLLAGMNATGTEDVKGCSYWGKLLVSAKEGRGFQWAELKGPGECETTMALNYSSGTTGFPKGVEITHRNYLANILMHAQPYTLKSGFEEAEKRQKWLCFLPMYHALGQTWFIAGSLMRNIPVYVMLKFDFLQMLKNIQMFKITELWFVPPVAVALAKYPAVKDFDLTSVKEVMCGAAPLGGDVGKEAEKIWKGRLSFRQAYGMTEATCAIMSWDPRLESDSFAVGEPLANLECKLMRSTDQSSIVEEVTGYGPENQGEIWIRGPNVMKGYWRNPKATKETMSPDGEGWLRTGDVAYADERGMFHIVDRIKELIKVKGNQVAPAEIEAILLGHSAVADVAVLGIQNADGDEKPKAFVVRNPGFEDKVTEQDLCDFLKDKVVSYKQLAGGVQWVDSIPKNPSGKILRRILREQWKQRQNLTGSKL